MELEYCSMGNVLGSGNGQMKGSFLFSFFHLYTVANCELKLIYLFFLIFIMDLYPSRVNV